MDLTEAEDINKTWQEYTELYKKDLHDPDNHYGVITHLDPNILEREVKWALGSITKNKASGGDGIPVEIFQILKDDAVKMLHSICQQIWKTQQWPQDWKSQFSFQSQRRAMPKNAQTTTQLHLSWAAVYGVAQSRTQLKQLSSSSRSIFIDRMIVLRIQISGLGLHTNSDAFSLELLEENVR